VSGSSSTASAGPVTIRLLGDLEMHIGARTVPASAWRRRDAAALVKVLALNPDRRLHRERVLDTLWPDLSPADAAPRLHKAAHYARRTVGRPDAVVLDRDMVGLLPGVDVCVDLAEFEVAAAEAVRDGGARAAALVLDGYPGEPLVPDLYEPWAEAVRERWRHTTMQLTRQAGRWQRLLQLDPTDEQAHVALMQTWIDRGDTAAAIRQFEQLDAILRAELGVGAGPAAARLRQQALAALRAAGPVEAAESERLEQRIQFCRTGDGVTLAYAITGSGFPLVRAAHWLTHLDHDWHSPVWRHWLMGLSAHHRLVRYDERGCGMSDWDIAPPTFADWLADLETVVDAAGLEHFDLLGFSQGGAVSIAYAARHPERVRRIVLGGAFEKGWLVGDDGGVAAETHRIFAESARIGWGRDDPWFRQLFTSRFMPGASRELWNAFNQLQRKTTRAETAVRVFDLCGSLDVSELAPQVRAPTLVLHGRADQVIPFSTGRRIAAVLPNSRFVPLDSDNHILLADEPAWPQFLAEVEGFLR
jgi:DNA-binding SARP family transcriptional activator/pimeloyl-ACP methyl ester carboxylesterase